MKIAITGATGQLGLLTIDNLIELGHSPSNIIAIVRDLEKAKTLVTKDIDVRFGDYNEPDSLENALVGIDKLLLISSSEVGQRLRQHTNVINAAIKNNIPYIAYTSILNADNSHLALAEEHIATENIIKQSGLEYTFLRNGWYSENYLNSVPTYIETQGILGTAKDGKISAAPRNSFAKAAAKVLLKDNVKKVYELAGDYSFSLSELAQAIGAVTNKEIQYIDLPAKEFEEKLISFDLPVPLAKILVDAEVNAANGELYSESKDLEELNGSKVPSLDSLIRNFL